MPTFGFSYFLKLLCLNERPLKTEVRNRLTPSDSAYDYHRSLRLRIQRALIHGEDFDEVIASTDQISRDAERNSARQGLERLRDWRAENPGALMPCASAVWESSDGEFKIRFDPDFAIDLGGQVTAIHVWNSLRPPLQDRMVYAALSLLPAAHADHETLPDDFAVLSLQTGRLYRLSDAPDHSLLAARLIESLDRLIGDTRDELERDGPGGRDRPPAGV